MSDYPKCETCKHWAAPKPNPPSWDWQAEFGECVAFLNEQDGSRLTLIEEVVTALPTFGCVLHSDLTEATP